MAETQTRRKVTGKLDFEPPSRPASPTKSRVTPSSTPTSTPSVRPRAKVSSSATVGGAARKPPAIHAPPYAASGSTSSAVSTPTRPMSPTKRIQIVHTANGRLSPGPTSSARARVTASTDTKSNASSSLPSSPRLGHVRATPVIATASDPSLNRSPPRARHASISSVSHVSVSARMHSTLSPVPSVSSAAKEEDASSSLSTVSAPVKVKAKVSGLAKSKVTTSMAPAPAQLPSPTAQSPSLSLPHPRRHIARTASISSISSREPAFYPITTASPNANIHRFATAQRPPSRSNRPQLSPSSPAFFEQKSVPVDPTSVPLPPLSPPSSTVSYSSRSTTSRSSVTSASQSTGATYSVHLNGFHDTSPEHVDLHLNGESSRSRTNSVIINDTGISYGDAHNVMVDDEAEKERKLKAEAKSNRKIADLEITNKSLLAINSSLEASKHKQAKEIRDLRRRLRESRLALPPRAYRVLKASDSPEEEEDEEDEEEDEEDEDGDGEVAIGSAMTKADETFVRVKGLLESMIDSGRRALEAKVEDFEETKAGTRVLHEIEARPWRDRQFSQDHVPGDEDLKDPDAYTNETADEHSVAMETDDEALTGSHPPSRPRSVVVVESSSFVSEDEVEAMIGERSPSSMSYNPASLSPNAVGIAI